MIQICHLIHLKIMSHQFLMQLLKDNKEVKVLNIHKHLMKEQNKMLKKYKRSMNSEDQILEN
jgi:hypothetical protein